MASMAAFLDANVVNVAVPAIQSDLHASVIALQWTLTGYLVTVAALLLVAGSLADRFGRRRILMIGLGVMLVASVLCALAPTSGALVAARMVQGVGAALVTPSSLSLLNGTLRVEDRARAIGIWAGLGTIGTTLGPYLGGWLVDNASWRAVFLLNLPLTLIGLYALRPVPESRGRIEKGGIDYVGGVLTAVGIGGVIYALTEGAASGWGRANVLIAGILGAVALLALVPLERDRSAPLIRLTLFRSRQFDAINATTLLFYGALAAGGYLIVLQAQLRLGYSAAQAGALLIPNSVVFLCLSPVSGALVARFGPRWLMVSGILLVAVAYVWLSALAPGRRLRHRGPARRAALRRRARAGGDAAHRRRARGGLGPRSRRGVRRQRRLGALRRRDRDRARARADRRQRRHARPRAGRRLPARDARARPA